MEPNQGQGLLGRVQGPAPQQQMQEAPVDDSPLAPPEDDPGYESAVNFFMTRLYEEGASDSVVEAVRVNPDDVAGTVAQLAFEITGEADAQAEPPMMEENIIPLALLILSELWEVAAAALKMPAEEIDDAEMAASFKTMLYRYLEESGVDTTELRSAMDAITPEQFREVSRQAMAANDDGAPQGAVA